MKEASKSILGFLHAVEQLKQELRHCWTSNGRQESVAEHSWRLALMLVICAPYLDKKIDLLKAIKMALFHDLGEALVGDKHYLDINSNSEERTHRFLLEKNAVRNLTSLLGADQSSIFNLWLEFENKNSEESRVVYFLDKLEVCIQHNEANISTWTQREIDSIEEYFDQLNSDDPFLLTLKECIRKDSFNKIEHNN